MPDISLNFTAEEIEQLRRFVDCWDYDDEDPAKLVATILQTKLPPELPGLKAWRISGGDRSTDPEWAMDWHLMVRSDLPGAQQLRFAKAEEGSWLASSLRLVSVVERANGAAHAVVGRVACVSAGAQHKAAVRMLADGDHAGLFDADYVALVDALAPGAEWYIASGNPTTEPARIVLGGRTVAVLMGMSQ